MTVEFQDEVIKFILQEKAGKSYIKLLDGFLFDMPEHQLVFEMVVKYFEMYRQIPGKAGLLEYFDQQSKKAVIRDDVYKKLDSTIRSFYRPSSGDTSMAKEEIIKFAKSQLTAKMFTKYADKINGGGSELYDQMYSEMRRITNLGKDEVDKDKYRGRALLRDHVSLKDQIKKGHPTYLNALNHTTAAGGFYSPQLIVLMGGPKSFKTGNLLKMGIEYMRTGLKVYYVDCENGLDSIYTRADQVLLEVERNELRSGDHEDAIQDIKRRIALRGGEFRAGFFVAHTKTVDDVRDELDWLRDEEGWEPDLILWDYPDLMQATDISKRKEKRINIQHVYFDIIELNVERDVFSIALSQVRKEAVNKMVIDMRDFAEDFAKAANAHAAFAICATEEEKMAGIARIIPVVQREGEMYMGDNACMVEIDYKRMKISERSHEEMLEHLRDLTESISKKKPQYRTIKVDPEGLQDA